MKKSIIRSTKNSSLDTSFHGYTVTTTRNDLKRVLGKPHYVNRDSDEKVQHEWILEIDGHVFTVYDWKEYRNVKASEPIEWHIGAKSSLVASHAQEELIELLEK